VDQSFLLILALEKHAVHNAITSINNSLMQSKIIIIGVASSELLIRSISVIISNKILLISARGSGGVVQASPVGSGAELRKTKHFWDLHSLKSFKGG